MTSNSILPKIIDNQSHLDSVISDLHNVSSYAIDTEFHREKTYYPRLALIQIRWDDSIALIDPLTVNLEGLSSIFQSDILAIFHAGSQDLEVLLRAVGEVPKQIFDTQIAAGFIGMRTPSLAALHETLLGIKLAKGDRLTDWFQRPLSENQLEYAASDVRYLLDVHQKLVHELESRNRLAWAESEFQLFLDKRQKVVEPINAWLKIKEAKHLSKKARGVAQALAEWRENAARRSDIPPRYVLSDLALIGIAQRMPKKASDLSNIRGVDAKQFQGNKASSLLQIVANGLSRDVKKPASKSQNNLKTELRPAVTLLSAWLSQYASDNEIDPALLGTRSDIEGLLRGDENPRLAEGWRHAEVGSPITQLLNGKATLAFSNGRLILEERIT